MATNYVQYGNVVPHTVVGADVLSGEVVDLTNLIGVAITNGLIGETIAVQVEGVWELPALTGALFIGEVVFWDGSDISNVNTGTPAGWCFETKAGGVLLAKVKLDIISIV